MSKEETRIKEIIVLLEGGDVDVRIVPRSKLPKGAWGICDRPKKKIMIWRKLQRNAQVFTLVHECLHLLKPRMPEEWIRPRAYKVWGVMTDEQHQKLNEFLGRLS